MTCPLCGNPTHECRWCPTCGKDSGLTEAELYWATLVWYATPRPASLPGESLPEVVR